MGNSTLEFRSPGQLPVPGALPLSCCCCCWKVSREGDGGLGRRSQPSLPAVVARPWAKAGGLSCACMLRSQSLPFARFCAEQLPRGPSSPPPSYTGAQEPPAPWSPAWAEPPGPYFCCWRQRLAHLWGVSTGQDGGRGLLGGPSLAPSGHMQPPWGSRPWAPPHCPPHQQPCFSSSQCTERGN